MIWCLFKLLYIVEKESLPDPYTILGYYEKIVSCLKIANKLDRVPMIYIQWINYLTGNKKWEEAETVALEALEDRSDQDDHAIIQKLEYIYESWSQAGDRLPNLWFSLGQKYENADIDRATEYYTNSYTRLQHFGTLQQLIELLLKMDRHVDAAVFCYKGLKRAAIDREVEQCRQLVGIMISRVDENLDYFSEKQKNAFKFFQEGYSSESLLPTTSGNLAEVPTGFQWNGSRIALGKPGDL
jgi:tetratricopeptide (TPR) repeat protein